MKSASLKDKTIRGLFWGGIDTLFTKGVNFVFNLLIARQLTPDDYGTIAILAVIMSICQCFVDSGFGAALIRKTDRTEADFSTVFYFNMIISLLLYILISSLSPFLADFYNNPILADITVIYTLVLIINSLAIVQNAKLTIDINFKAFAKISIFSSVLSGTIALWMAMKGYGIWTLVAQSLINSAIRTILLWIVSKWRPQLLFSWQSFKEFFSFGSKLLGSSLVNAIYNNIYTLVIGKVHSAELLGTYKRGGSIAEFPAEGINSVLANVSYPVLSSIQNDKDRCLQSCRQFVRMTSFIIFPMMVGLAAIADPFIRLCLTDKWAKAIPVMQLLCFAFIWNPITSIDYAIQKITGHSEYFLRMTIISKIIGISILCLTATIGIYAICIGQILSSIVVLPIYSYYTQKAIGYTFKQKVLDCGKTLILSIGMGVLVYTVILLVSNIYLKLIAGILSGIAFYYLTAKKLKLVEIAFIIDTIKQYIKKR